MRPNDLEKKENGAPGEELDYQSKLLFTSFEIRIFNILVALVCATIVRYFFGVAVPWQVQFIFYLWLCTSAIYLILFSSGICKTVRRLDSTHFSYYFFGVLYVTTLVHYLGGAGWIAFLFYLFDLVYSNVLMRRSRGAVITIFIAACYFALILLEYNGIIGRYRIFAPIGTGYGSLKYFFATNILVVGSVFFLMSYSTGLFSKMKEDREKDLNRSKNRFAVKSKQLEDITRVLRKEAAENKYLKRAAMGYIEKKEFELETAKKDLEEQIENLRRTQKAMFFMIKDLNEMSVQLKDARDHLEEKVRERTDELLNISRKLHRSERLAFLGKLAGSVTHELRNPLAVLKNAAYFLDKKFQKDKDEKVPKYIDIMKKEITIIDAIIDDIMGFARTKAPDLKETVVKDVVGNAISAINVPDLVEIKTQFEKIPRAYVDSNQIMHAIMNVANNAIMAMNGNGTLTVRVLQKGEYACIEIEDTGSGIPPDQRGLIFEPLYSSKPKGTGLGLPIAKMMIENQDGRIEFQSELGEGTVFRIFLPFKREEKEK